MGGTGDRTSIVLKVKKLNVISSGEKISFLIQFEAGLKTPKASLGQLMCHNKNTDYFEDFFL